MSNRTLGLGGSDLPRPGRCGREREREIQIYTKRYKDIVSCWEIESLPIPVGAWSWRVPCCWAASLDDSTTRRCSSFTVSYVCYVSFVFRSFSGRLGGERRRLDDSVRFFLLLLIYFVVLFFVINTCLFVADGLIPTTPFVQGRGRQRGVGGSNVEVLHGFGC